MKKKLLVLLLCAWMCTAALPVSAKSAFTGMSRQTHGTPPMWNAVSSGLINGKSDTQFVPEEYLTAAEAVKLAACLHQYAAEGRVTLTPGTLWYRTYVDYVLRGSFYGCSSLRSVYFMGVLPEYLISSFEECPDDLTLYYIEGKEGWSSPTVTVGGVVETPTYSILCWRGAWR